MGWNLVVFLLVLVNFSVSSQVDEGLLLANWKADHLVGSSTYNNTYNEVWGLAINGSEYAIIGSTAGTHFVNISDPKKPAEDFFVQGPSHGAHVIHRDFHDHKGYLYIVSDEETTALPASLQIVDISMLPEKVEVVYDSNESIGRAHNIFIDTAQSRLYAFSAKGGDDSYAPLRIYDIEDPLTPKKLGDFRLGLDGLVVGHYHDGFIRNHIAYLNAGNDGLVIADLTDPSNPILLTHLTASDYPEPGYNHSGWLSEDSRHYYMGDETWGTSMKVFDVSDPSNVIVSSTFNAESESAFSIAHNQVVHCNYLFASYYYDGLQVYDIRDPENPERVLHYPTSSLTAKVNYEGAWGVYPFLPSGNILVSDMQNGLFIVKGFADYCATSLAGDAVSTMPTSKIFPNPSSGKLTIRTRTNIKSIVVYDSVGKRIKTVKNINSQTFEIYLLSPGIFFASIFTDSGREIKKIIIQE